MTSSTTLSVEDRLDILDLYSRQSHAIDSDDGEKWAETFTTDGTFTSPTYSVVVSGRIDLARFARTSNATARDQGDRFRHVVTSVVLDLRYDGSVGGTAYLMILRIGSAGVRMDRSVVLHDVLHRADGQWRFATRVVERDGSDVSAASDSRKVN